MDLDELRRRVARLEGRPVDTASLPVHPALAGLLTPRAGGIYGVDAASLALTLVSGPSAAGGWCGVVGCPDLGLEAAREAGIDTDRLVVVPDPAEAWWEVVAALVDTLALVVVRPPARVPQRDAARLAARLRSRQCVLVVWGAWPRCDGQLSLVSSQWNGVGVGHGHLRSRRAVIEARTAVTVARRREVWLPGDTGYADPQARDLDRTGSRVVDLGGGAGPRAADIGGGAGPRAADIGGGAGPRAADDRELLRGAS